MHYHLPCPCRQLTIIAGLGRALVEALLSQPANTVIAAVRDPRSPNSLSLTEFPRAADTELITIKIDSTSDSDAYDAAQVLTSEHGVEKLDVVIANAGFGEIYGDLTTVKPEEVSRLVDVNGIGKQDMFTWTLRHWTVGTSASYAIRADFNSGPLRLFQGVRKLFENSPTGKFVLLGSPIASIGGMEKAPWPMFAYGASKTVAHYLTRKIHYESPDVTAFVMDPG
jgi:norsolorinic acid ketoreductase